MLDEAEARLLIDRPTWTEPLPEARAATLAERVAYALGQLTDLQTAEERPRSPAAPPGTAGFQPALTHGLDEWIQLLHTLQAQLKIQHPQQALNLPILPTPEMRWLIGAGGQRVSLGLDLSIDAPGEHRIQGQLAAQGLDGTALRLPFPFQLTAAQAGSPYRVADIAPYQVGDGLADTDLVPVKLDLQDVSSEYDFLETAADRIARALDLLHPDLDRQEPFVDFNLETAVDR